MKLSLIAASLISALALTQAASDKTCEKKYQVTKGDTCQSIAEKFNLTEDHLKQWNKKLESNFDCNKLTAQKDVCVKFSENIEKRSDEHDKKKVTTINKHRKATTTKKRHEKAINNKDEKKKKTTKKDESKKKITKKNH